MMMMIDECFDCSSAVWWKSCMEWWNKSNASDWARWWMKCPTTSPCSNGARRSVLFSQKTCTNLILRFYVGQRRLSCNSNNFRLMIVIFCAVLTFTGIIKYTDKQNETKLTTQRTSTCWWIQIITNNLNYMQLKFLLSPYDDCNCYKDFSCI